MAEYFALIGGKVTDVSTHEQVSVCVRSVECTGGKVTRREECLGFVRASETTGENLACCLNFGILIDNVVEQQACRVFTEVFKPGLGNRFPTVQCVHYKAHVGRMP